MDVVNKLLIEVEGITYELGGSYIVPNPEGEGTIQLRKVQIEDTIYFVPDKLSQMTNDTNFTTQQYVQGLIDTVTAALNLHKADKANPHEVTKTQVGLGNVTNDAQVKGLASGTTEDHIVVFGADGYSVKDSGKTLADTGKIDSISIDGTDIPADANKNVDLPAYPTKTSLGLDNVENTGDSDTPVENGVQKFTTGGAYTLKSDLHQEVETEKTARTNQCNEIDGKLNEDVALKPSSNQITYSGDTVTITISYKNLKTGTASSRTETVSLANSTTAGLMSHSDYIALYAAISRIENLEGQTTRLLYTTSQNPTQQNIQDFVDNYLTAAGVSPITSEDYAGIAVVVAGTYHIWHYYANDNIGWKDDGQDTVSQFSNSIAGIVLGTADNNDHTNDGKLFAENDGTGSVLGWDRLTTRMTNVENNKMDRSEMVAITTAQINALFS